MGILFLLMCDFVAGTHSTSPEMVSLEKQSDDLRVMQADIGRLIVAQDNFNAGTRGFAVQFKDHDFKLGRHDEQLQEHGFQLGMMLKVLFGVAIASLGGFVFNFLRIQKAQSTADHAGNLASQNLVNAAWDAAERHVREKYGKTRKARVARPLSSNGYVQHLAQVLFAKAPDTSLGKIESVDQHVAGTMLYGVLASTHGGTGTGANGEKSPKRAGRRSYVWDAQGWTEAMKRDFLQDIAPNKPEPGNAKEFEDALTQAWKNAARRWHGDSRCSPIRRRGSA